ncbi:hypothetical protein M5K25_012589 [Dendrobium thyrsiflorum]|uniref:RING-type E3 ubiquitin transferase n=1 Tax=Dendrobium thyrsiflorum TaxID=117978 RepID=A0ABD0UXW8_DENTH
MGDQNPSSNQGYNTDGSATANKITSTAMVLTAIFFFLAVIFVLFLYLYTHYRWFGRSITRRRPARTNFIFAAGDASLPSIGLNPSILLSLPITIYRSNDSKEGLECAVCLSELSDGEKARLLPNCSHGFHLECIDMWFRTHSTCPLCRCPVGGERELSLSEPAGLQGGIMLGILSPDHSTEMFQSSLSPLTSSRSPMEEIKSPVEEGISPARLKVGSFKRISSRGKMTGGSCCSSPRVSDIEQGLVGYGEVNGEGSSVSPKEPESPIL